MSGLIQRDFKSSHQRTISICLITTIPFNKFRKNHVPSHIHLYILDEAKMKEIWNFTYIEANLINSSKFDVTSNETFLRWSNRMPISIAIALDKVATPFASIETTNLSLSVPPPFPRSIIAACISGGEGCQWEYERSVSARDGWRKKLEYGRACPVILSSWTTMNRCNAGKRLLHGNKRICARCMINKEEREEPFPSLFICPLFDSPPSTLRNIARIRARLYLVPRYSCRSNAAVLQTWSIPSFLRGTLRKIWKLIVDVSIPKKE